MVQSHKGVVVSKLGLLLDIVCLAIAGVVLWAVKNYVSTNQRGFFCDDDSITYPLSSETVSYHLLRYISYAGPAVVFVVVEVLLALFARSTDDTHYSVCIGLVYRLCELYGCFAFGMFLEETTTELAKRTVGRLRPYFLAICDLEVDVCSNLTDPFTYVTEYECTGETSQARLSFPSGHSSLSFYAAVYVALYLHYRLRSPKLRALRLLLQALALIVAWFIALSRIHDNVHHPTDVLAGSLVGCFWAFIVVTFLIDMRTASRHKTDEECTLNGQEQDLKHV